MIGMAAPVLAVPTIPALRHRGHPACRSGSVLIRRASKQPSQTLAVADRTQSPDLAFPRKNLGPRERIDPRLKGAQMRRDNADILIVIEQPERKGYRRNNNKNNSC